ncbi:DUF2207 domain-containing protein [Flavobacterium sp. MC2016-06]|uniref:DUF2207 domain-containing protein n=1 Tax=Flavobacterium sp. MC2016-06 TaxID=2676308 RepID=UPI0012BB0120|nr:DUF2207 domain-containing protein [Flavobacterium sp. MC2016-06]MBU3862148.1 DUF2207 domain-containing protein [Flavobacterium sp. MC2016-06]
MKQLRSILFFSVLLFSLFPCYSQEETTDSSTENEIEQTEKINQFHSDIQVKENGNMLVTETISVYAIGQKINHGIYRVLPLTSNSSKGNKNTYYTILSVIKDGLKEPYHTKRNGGNLSLYVGDKDASLTAGNYTYKITYEVEAQIHSYKDFDEIYWNVTGNEWDFEINNVSATVSLPGWASAIQMHCYTGILGSKESNCDTKVGGNTIYFTSKNLKENEGFTVAVGFPKGIVHQPFFLPHYKIEEFFSSEKIITGLLPIFICFLFFFFSWKRYGEDPIESEKIELTDLKKQFSAPALQYLKQRYCNSDTLLITIISLSLKGAIQIGEKGKEKWYESFEYFLTKGTKSNALSKEEEEVFESLFEESDTVTLDNETYKLFKKATEVLEKSLSAQYNLKDYFSANIYQILIGFTVTITALAGYCYITERPQLGIAALGASFFVISIIAVRAIIKTLLKKEYAYIGFYIFGAFFFGIFGFVCFSASNINKDYSILNVLVVFLIITGFATYLVLIGAYTKLGLQTNLQIQKFKQYLLAFPAEQNISSIAIYEENLPYAFALGIQEKWNEKFAVILKNLNYTSNWVRTSNGYSDFANNGFVRFRTSCTTASSSPSSGSGGGGSSGGGSGGGGGGGW